MVITRFPPSRPCPFRVPDSDRACNGDPARGSQSVSRWGTGVQCTIQRAMWTRPCSLHPSSSGPRKLQASAGVMPCGQTWYRQGKGAYNHPPAWALPIMHPANRIALKRRITQLSLSLSLILVPDVPCADITFCRSGERHAAAGKVRGFFARFSLAFPINSACSRKNRLSSQHHRRPPNRENDHLCTGPSETEFSGAAVRTPDRDRQGHPSSCVTVIPSVPSTEPSN